MASSPSCTQWSPLLVTGCAAMHTCMQIYTLQPPVGSLLLSAVQASVDVSLIALLVILVVVPAAGVWQLGQQPGRVFALSPGQLDDGFRQNPSGGARKFQLSGGQGPAADLHRAMQKTPCPRPTIILCSMPRIDCHFTRFLEVMCWANNILLLPACRFLRSLRASPDPCQPCLCSFSHAACCSSPFDSWQLSSLPSFHHKSS